MTALLLPPSAVGVFALAFVLLLLAGSALPRSRQSQRLSKRIHALTGKPDRPAATRPTTSLRRAERRTWLGPIAQTLQKSLPLAANLREQLLRAGYGCGVAEFLAACSLGAVAVAAAMRLGLGAGYPMSVVVGLATAAMVAKLLLGHRMASRGRRLVAMLPDGIDLIVRGLRSGLPATEALQTIGEEMADPLGSVFREVTGSLRLGIPLDQALWAVARRLGVQELKFLVISLSIQQETGGNLAEILYNLSQMIRRREQVKLKVRAMSSEARASAMIIGSLPFVMAAIIYVVNPDYIMALFNDRRGWVLIAAATVSMLTGLGIMARMVKFEI